jgi:hypothetical protein
MRSSPVSYPFTSQGDFPDREDLLIGVKMAAYSSITLIHAVRSAGHEARVALVGCDKVR